MPPNLQFPADLATYTEEILNGKHHFLCSENNFLLALKLLIFHNACLKNLCR